jgi:hypothetical protein
MISPKEFVERWASGKLVDMRPDWESPEWWETNKIVRYAPDVVKQLPIPETSLRFLIEAGLP